MSDASKEAQDLFDRYLDCWNRRDLEGVVTCYDEPTTFVLPSGAVTLPNRQVLLAFFEEMISELEKSGFSHTTLGPVSAVSCGNGLAVVDVSNVQRFKKDGSLLEKIDSHYVMRNCEGTWRLTVALPCANGWRSA
ncbi:nuclear transport factor 2 family protein [Roseibium sp. SCPC15]|uniref:nuclear transport factor 2 family protein n=1 Tax=Roseibium sp. SCP15 TaxID=3141376 RepID=UPI00333B7CA8